MAVLLKDTKDHTIQGRITRYVRANGYYLFLSVFFCVFMVAAAFYQYFSMNHQHLTLNTFYETVNALDSSVYVYVLNPSEENYRNYLESEEAARRSFAPTEALCRDAVYRRENRDLSHMLARICDTGRTEEAGTAGQPVRLFSYQMYEEKHTVVESILKTYQNMYRRFLTVSEERLHGMIRRVIFFFLIYLIFITVEIMTWRRRVDRLSLSLAEPITFFADHIRQAGENGTAHMEPVEIQDDFYDELRMMADVYNKMTEMIGCHQKERERYYQNEIELEKHIAENLRISGRLEGLRYKALQEQINPHFLFNTMNMMLQSAYINDDMETAELLGHTSNLLRYALDSSVEKSVALHDELEALDSYISIQKKRFGERICFYQELDERLHNIQVPGLILQPLVENAISHGLKTYVDGGWIRIETAVMEAEACGLIRVCDNGNGMSPKRVETIMQGIYEEEDNGVCIGLHNVYQRLNIFFHGKATMRIKSQKGNGTEVSLLFPWEA